MYKLGGRGGGGKKRPPAPHGRSRGASSSMGGVAPPRRRRAAAAAVAAAFAVVAAQAAQRSRRRRAFAVAFAVAAARAEGQEESFSLDSSGPPAFAVIIKLTPDLVDEIRRAEEAGSGARIKFNSEINPAENIIDVGEKKFNFTYTCERGELCDIYEERQSGEDGNGLLIEHGSAWRKVNVQRILDESERNIVKMRREEAGRLRRSRNSIVLDPVNPSVKSQDKSMTAAAVEDSVKKGHAEPSEKIGALAVVEEEEAEVEAGTVAVVAGAGEATRRNPIINPAVLPVQSLQLRQVIAIAAFIVTYYAVFVRLS